MSNLSIGQSIKGLLVTFATSSLHNIKVAKHNEMRSVKIKEKLKTMKTRNVAIITIYCHLRPTDAIAFPT